MRILGHFIVRFIAIVFGVAIAVLTASLFLSAGLLWGYFTELMIDMNQVLEGELRDTDSIVLFLVGLIGILASFRIMALALIPMMLAIVLAEFMRWRGLTINLVLGGLVSFFAGTSVFAVDAGELPSQGTLVVLLAAGFVGGFFYWLVAGRSAGRWLDRQSDP